MIEKALNKLSRLVVKECSWDDNVLVHNPKVQSTVDEGKGLKPIERAVHIYNEIKKA